MAYNQGNDFWDLNMEFKEDDLTVARADAQKKTYHT